jgi:teichoic acid transport system permease protein
VTTIEGGDSIAPSASARAAEELAARHGLIKVGKELSLRDYIAQLWERRYFVTTFAKARVQSENARNHLGDVWLVLTPLLNAAVYYFIFGVILKTSRDVENFVAFLIIGVFLFTYLQRCISSGATSVSGNLGMIRAFHFPRAVLPISSTTKQFMQLGYSMVIMIIIVLLTGEPITWRWLLLIPTIALLTLFSAGLGMIAARITTRFNDFNSLLPFLLRTWLYVSGVFFSIQSFSDRVGPVLGAVLIYQPGAVYLECARYALLEGQTANPWMFLAATLWALLAIIGGFLYFWRGEGRYGRG